MQVSEFDNEQKSVWAELLVMYAENVALKNKSASREAIRQAYERRKLDYRCKVSLTPKQAYPLMAKVCDSYNEFTADLLKLLPDDCKVFLAREGSPCVYVQPGKTPIPDKDTMQANEYMLLTEDTYGDVSFSPMFKETGGYKGEIRIWWD